MCKAQVKSKDRVADHGEVFTAPREVKAMCTLVRSEAARADSRILEPACGDGNFLDEILRRRLASVRRQYGNRPSDFEKYSVLAVSGLYGIDIQDDNVEECRTRLFRRWAWQYKAVCGKRCDSRVSDGVEQILTTNIICGNTLTGRTAKGGKETDDPIVFSEWAFVSGPMMSETRYALSDLDKPLNQRIIDYRRICENE